MSQSYPRNHSPTDLDMTVPAKTQDRSQKADTDAAKLLFGGTDRFFRRAVNSSHTPYLITDPNQADNPVVYVNQAFLDMTGYSEEEVLGRNCRFLQGPETDATAISSLRRAVASHQDVSIELINYRKDGSPFWNEVSIAPVFNDAQELTFFFASQKDITQRRTAEEALSQAHKMKALGDLTGGIAHDFNNLLQVVSGYLDVIERTASNPAADTSSIVRNVSRAREAATRATDLTQLLLAFSRSQRLDAEPLDLNEIILATSQSDSLPLARTQVQKHLEPDLWRCKLDPAQVRKAFMNVLTNCCEAMEGHPSPWIRMKSSNIEVSGPSGVPSWAGLLPGRYVSVALSDNGGGMDEAVRRRVMDPFFSTKEEGKGPGLGLSAVQGFVLQSGGAIRISTRRNVGTTVLLYFPAQSDAEPIPPDSPGFVLDEKDLGGTEAILIVEDRPDVAQLAYELLARNGYRPAIAHNGEEAWDRITTGEHYQLVFSDVMMPGELNGVDLARKIERRFPETGILLTSGFTKDSIECTDATGSRYALLSKPYQSKELLSMVRTSLDTRRKDGPRMPAAQQPRKQKA